MVFRIADTFTSSLARLAGDEQKAVKTTAFDLQLDPASPGMQFHKLDKARDKNFWSVRVSADIRLIVHKTADSHFESFEVDEHAVGVDVRACDDHLDCAGVPVWKAATLWMTAEHVPALHGEAATDPIHGLKCTP